MVPAPQAGSVMMAATWSTPWVRIARSVASTQGSWSPRSLHSGYVWPTEQR